MWETSNRGLYEFGVLGPLLSAIPSLYDRKKSFVCKAGSKSDQVLVLVVLWQGCPLSLDLFTVFMDSF